MVVVGLAPAGPRLTIFFFFFPLVNFQRRSRLCTTLACAARLAPYDRSSEVAVHAWALGWGLIQHLFPRSHPPPPSYYI